jgi:nitrate reductase NapE component
VNTLFRVLLAIWVVLYLVIACAPVLSNSVFVGGIGFRVRDHPLGAVAGRLGHPRLPDLADESQAPLIA